MWKTAGEKSVFIPKIYEIKFRKFMKLNFENNFKKKFWINFRKDFKDILTGYSGWRR